MYSARTVSHAADMCVITHCSSHSSSSSSPLSSSPPDASSSNSASESRALVCHTASFVRLDDLLDRWAESLQSTLLYYCSGNCSGYIGASAPGKYYLTRPAIWPGGAGLMRPPRPRSLRVLFSFILLTYEFGLGSYWCVGPLGTAMRVRVLHAKLYAYALPGSTARQLFNSSTLLDSWTARQNSTELDRPRRPGTWSQPRQARQSSTGTRQARQARQARPRQRLSTAPRLSASTERRSLDSCGQHTARQPGLNGPLVTRVRTSVHEGVLRTFSREVRPCVHI